MTTFVVSTRASASRLGNQLGESLNMMFSRMNVHQVESQPDRPLVLHSAEPGTTRGNDRFGNRRLQVVEFVAHDAGWFPTCTRDRKLAIFEEAEARVAEEVLELPGQNYVAFDSFANDIPTVGAQREPYRQPRTATGSGHTTPKCIDGLVGRDNTK
jgi:hypothetical protein